MKIEALHDFHNADFSKGWADKFEPTPERLRLFETILQQIRESDFDDLSILELGIGPGFLAKYLLEKLHNVSYEGLDFSASMLDIAKKRTKAFGNRISFTQADLINDPWGNSIKKKPNIIVSTWALHDLFEEKHILNVYKTVYEILPEGGIFLNGDFIKPELSKHEYEGGRIKPSEHLKLLESSGFSNFECLEEFEKSITSPTTSNNYACFKAAK